MLSQVRGALKGVTAWFVIILLILAFALFGVPELRTMTQGSALKVGDQSFSSNYVQNEFSRIFNIRRQESGNTLTREQALATGLPDQVIQSIATSSALEQAAIKMGLSAPREIVRDYLQTNENFQNPVTGSFDATILDAILRNNNLSVKEFEKRIADELLRNQLVASLVASGAAPEPMAEAMLLRETERRRVAYLIVTDEMAGVAAEPTPDDIETYYNEHPDEFTAPEYRTFELVALEEKAFRDGLSAPEEELRRIYDRNKERIYDIPEKRTLYQITFDTEAEATGAVAALEQGQPFETIAEQKNASLASLTFTDITENDIIDPSVRAAAFSSELSEGDVAGPIKGLFGWTVAQVAGVTPQESQSFEDVRDDIEADYLNADTRRKMLEAIDIIEEARDVGASLADAAESAGVAVTTIGPIDQYSFTPGGAIIDNAPGEAIQEAFRLEEGEESEAEELALERGYFFVALDSITPPALEPLEIVRDEVEDRWRAQERSDRIAKTISNIEAEMDAGKTLEEASQPFDRTPVVELIDRRGVDEAISAEMREQIFFADLGDVVTGAAGLGSSQIIADVREIGYGRSTVSPQEAKSYRDFLGYQLDQELLQAYVDGVREDFGVRVDRSQLDTLFTDG
ncbi:MAG: SurA N-terminal domain-containing protein [Pseudomonadota bacterium]